MEVLQSLISDLSLKRITAVLFFISIISFGCSSQPSKSDTSENVVLEVSESISIDPTWQLKEKKYAEILAPVNRLKEQDPTLFYFIVSWLGTNYNTPNWDGYYSDDWQKAAMLHGIDCSGFARVLQDQIFQRNIRGGSRGILKLYCVSITKSELELGDLVFFKAPGTDNKRIVHVGTYLFDGYFVHATSKRSASKDRGVDISSLSQHRWKENLVAAGRVKQ